MTLSSFSLPLFLHLQWQQQALGRRRTPTPSRYGGTGSRFWESGGSQICQLVLFDLGRGGAGRLALYLKCTGGPEFTPQSPCAKAGHNGNYPSSEEAEPRGSLDSLTSLPSWQVLGQLWSSFKKQDWWFLENSIQGWPLTSIGTNTSNSKQPRDPSLSQAGRGGPRPPSTCVL